jgi:hypothetical protein
VRHSLHLERTGLLSGSCLASLSSTSPLEAFFAHYDADYNRHMSAAEQYQSLGARRGWDRDDWSDARRLFNDAIAREFNSLYGEDVNRLDNWQSLCEEVHIDPVPNTIGQCKAVRHALRLRTVQELTCAMQAIKGVYVNIVDLVDSRTRGKRVDTFHTLAELSEYSQETRKIFPRNQASAGNLLKYLLREILGGSGSRGYYQRY